MTQNDEFLGGMYQKKFDDDGRFECVSMLHPGENFTQTVLKIKPDLILLGIIFDGADGFKVMEDLQINPVTKKIPVIFFTNLEQKDDIERAMRLGAADYVIMASKMPAEILDICGKYLNL